MHKDLLLVDGSNLFARAYWTLRVKELGQLPPHVARMLQSVLSRWPHRHLMVALDAGQSFRHELIPGYKAEREERRRGASTTDMTEALRPHLDAWGVALRWAEGNEADDVIATLVSQAVTAGHSVSILSKDSDLCQLVDDEAGVRLLWPSGTGEGEVALGDEDVFNQVGVYPDEILDWRTMAGGKDSLPRIGGPKEGPAPYGITERRAAALLADNFTLDSLIAGRPAELTERERAWFAACAPEALKRREALRLRTDLELSSNGGHTSVARLDFARTPAPSTPAAPERENPYLEPKKVLCAGGCGRMESREPYHDPKAVYCTGCGIRAGRERPAPVCACGNPIEDNARLFGDGRQCSGCTVRQKVGRGNEDGHRSAMEVRCPG